jgi:hypothetical protein
MARYTEKQIKGMTAEDLVAIPQEQVEGWKEGGPLKTAYQNRKAELAASKPQQTEVTEKPQPAAQKKKAKKRKGPTEAMISRKALILEQSKKVMLSHDEAVLRLPPGIKDRPISCNCKGCADRHPEKKVDSGVIGHVLARKRMDVVDPENPGNKLVVQFKYPRFHTFSLERMDALTRGKKFVLAQWFQGKFFQGVLPIICDWDRLWMTDNVILPALQMEIKPILQQQGVPADQIEAQSLLEAKKAFHKGSWFEPLSVQAARLVKDEKLLTQMQEQLLKALGGRAA